MELSKRTHGARIKAQHERSGLSPASISAQKNQRCKARGEARKKANVERHAEYRAATAKLGPAGLLAKLDSAYGKGNGAGKQRARIAKALAAQPAKPEKKSAKPVDKRGRAK